MRMARTRDHDLNDPLLQEQGKGEKRPAQDKGNGQQVDHGVLGLGMDELQQGRQRPKHGIPQPYGIPQGALDQLWGNIRQRAADKRKQKIDRLFWICMIARLASWSSGN